MRRCWRCERFVSGVLRYVAWWYRLEDGRIVHSTELDACPRHAGFGYAQAKENA